MLEQLKRRYAKAKLDHSMAETARERDSAVHLASILKKDVRQQFAHVEDDGLTAADRNRLRRRVMADLPRETFLSRLRARVPPATVLSGRLLVFLRRNLVVPAGIAGLSVCAWVAWQNTAQPALMKGDPTISLRFPSGGQTSRRFNAGAVVWVLDHGDGNAIVREWHPGAGYAFGRLYFTPE